MPLGRPTLFVRLAAQTRRSARRLTHSRVALIVTIAAVLCTVSTVTYGYASLTTEVTLSVDGKERTVSTFGTTVADVLEAAEIEVGDRDVVQPAPRESIDSGDRIAVRFSRPVELTVDGETSTHWVTATDVQGALGQIGAADPDSRLSTSRGTPISRGGAEIEVVTAKALTFALAGAEPVAREVTALTVEEALTQVGVALDEHDRVRPRRGAPVEDGDRIVFTDVDVTQRSVEGESFSVPAKQVDDDSMLEGERKVDTKAAAGIRDITYEIRTRNGKVVRRTVLTQEVRKAPRAAVIRVGTKEPEPEPVVSTGGSGVWDRLAQGEAGGHWGINTGNGYYGGLQFSLGTWRAYGGPGMPHQASKATQIAIATKVRDATGGYGSWPGCAAKLGLPR